jgi:TPR repeat protein
MGRVFGTFLIALMATINLPTNGFADLQKGGEAYNRGDYAAALKEWRPLAEQGSAKAQDNLGHMYAIGQGVHQDYKTAFKWYNLAAEQGNADAQYNLGWMFLGGRGVLHDKKEAVKWTRLSAEQGFAKAQHNMGWMFHEGLGVLQDDKVAVKWFRKSAKQGLPDSQFRLGLMYTEGRGVPQEYTEAFKWFLLSAEQGFVEAQALLGFTYENGLGVKKNTNQAIKWYRLASEQGSVKAQEQLARLGGKKPQIASTTSPVANTKNNSASTILSKPIDVRFRSSVTKPDDIAVIIANSNYTEGKDIPNVIPAYADSEGIKNYVTQALGIVEDNIIFIKDATQKDLIGTFGNKDIHKGRLFRYLTKGKSNVFVFYSGHGAPGDEDTNYLVPTDAEASMIDLHGYSLKTLYQNLSKLPAKSVTVVLEACFSGASEAGTVISNASPILLQAKDTGVPSNITVIAAGAANQIASWETDKSHGLFTKYFLKGMSGEADNDNDRKVSWSELRNYLAKTVTRSAMRNYGREQTPQIVVGMGG